MTTPNMTTPTSTPRSPSRDDPGTTPCPVCDHPFTPTGRQTYCSTICRKTAFRRRHQQTGPAITVPTPRPRRQITVYECPDCGQRLLGEQRCPDCHTFARRISVGGTCPHCEEPVAITDLLDNATVTTRPATSTAQPAPVGRFVAARGQKFVALDIRVGAELRPPFAGQWRASRGEYRVRYRIDHTEGIVFVLDIDHRRDAYRS